MAGPASTAREKVCAACGRRFSWRKKWSRDWEAVRYCSAACRKAGNDPKLENAIVEMLLARSAESSLCPSEVARRLEGEESAWRALMEPVRRAARRLAHRGIVEITQKGKVVDPSDFHGPVRLRRGPELSGS